MSNDVSNSEQGHYDGEGYWWEIDANYPDWPEDDPFWDLADQECAACYGTGVEDGDLYNPDDPPCLACGGYGVV